MLILVCFGICLLLQPNFIGGQNVDIDVEPATFLPAVTPSASIRCTVRQDNKTEKPVQVLIMQISKMEPNVQQNNDKDADSKRETMYEEAADAVTEVLMVTATSGSARATLNVDDQNGRLTADGALPAPDGSQPSVALRIGSPMEEQDAGRFVCEVSVLDSSFKIKVLRAEAHLSIIDKEGSSVLLLAKEQILEEQQKELQKEEQHIKTDLQQALEQQKDLSDSVDDLKSLIETLTSRLDAMDGMVKTMAKKLEGAELEAALKEPISGDVSKEQFEALKSQLEHLENNALRDLQNRLESVEKDALTDIKERLKALEETSGGSEGAATDRGNESVDSSSDEDVKKLKLRLNAMTNDIIVPLQKKLDQLENENLHKLDTRLMNVEEEVPQVREKVGNLHKELQNLTDEVLRLRQGARSSGLASSVDELEDKGRPSESSTELSRKCHVCGDIGSKSPCTLDDLKVFRMQSCNHGEQFCMNDIIQDGKTRLIFKRCVDEDTCKGSHNAHEPMCANFNFMSMGTFQCHYCCTQDGCNVGFKPGKGLLN